MDLIPAIDIIDGACVRLQQGDYASKKVYSGRPEETASRFEEMGIRRLHLVDLDGAREGRVVNLDILEKIRERTSLVIDFGGGVKTEEDLQRVFAAGAEMVTAGSIAIRDPQCVIKWLDEYGPQRIILGADVRQGMISIQGWQEDTCQDLFGFLRRFSEAGIRTVICTDITADGMLQGPAQELYRDLVQAFPALEIIASGGVSGMGDILDLEAAGVSGVIFGKAYYENRITDDDIRDFLKYH